VCATPGYTDGAQAGGGCDVAAGLDGGGGGGGAGGGARGWMEVHWGGDPVGGWGDLLNPCSSPHTFVGGGGRRPVYVGHVWVLSVPFFVSVFLGGGLVALFPGLAV